MDFGKLPNVDAVDFRLPPDPAANAGLLSALPARTGGMQLYIGATGYNMKPWTGQWYPAGAKEKDFLKHYGAQFNTIEHNTTHYRIPDTTTVLRWRDDTPDDFRFSPKIPQTISHARNLGLDDGQFSYFCDQITQLDGRLGWSFLQLPPHFALRDVPRLGALLKIVPPTLPLAVEVRNEDFFEATPAAEAYFQLLATYGVATVITDVSGRRDVCHCRLTASCVLIRFVGNSLHRSDYSRIEEWAERLRLWSDAGLHTVYFFTHEPDNLLAPDLAAFACDVFSRAIPDVQVRGPKRIVTAVQGTLF
jgi:uncharacterized protein YecE (DUF72 family)